MHAFCYLDKQDFDMCKNTLLRRFNGIPLDFWTISFFVSKTLLLDICSFRKKKGRKEKRFFHLWTSTSNFLFHCCGTFAASLHSWVRWFMRYIIGLVMWNWLKRHCLNCWRNIDFGIRVLCEVPLSAFFALFWTSVIGNSLLQKCIKLPSRMLKAEITH